MQCQWLTRISCASADFEFLGMLVYNGWQKKVKINCEIQHLPRLKPALANVREATEESASASSPKTPRR